MLIVIEGSDKAGKTTQINLLMESLKDVKVATMAFPDYSTRIGKEIRAFLSGEVSYPPEVRHMLLSANRWEKKALLESMIRDNELVILNRYYQSNLVYGIANGLDLRWLEALDRGLPKEDLTIVFDIEPEVMIKRMTGKGDRFESDIPMMKRVSQLYRELASKYGWILINADRSVDAIHRDLIKIVRENKKFSYSP